MKKKIAKRTVDKITKINKLFREATEEMPITTEELGEAILTAVHWVSVGIKIGLKKARNKKNQKK